MKWNKHCIEKVTRVWKTHNFELLGVSHVSMMSGMELLWRRTTTKSYNTTLNTQVGHVLYILIPGPRCLLNNWAILKCTYQRCLWNNWALNILTTIKSHVQYTNYLCVVMLSWYTHPTGVCWLFILCISLLISHAWQTKGIVMSVSVRQGREWLKSILTSFMEQKCKNLLHPGENYFKRKRALYWGTWID